MSERIVCKAKRNFLVYVFVFLRGCILPLIGFLVYWKFPEIYCAAFGIERDFDVTDMSNPISYVAIAIGGVIMLCGVIFLIISILKLICSKLVITERRVYGSNGVLKKEGVDMPLDKIDSLIEKKTVLGSVLRYSTVIVQTYAAKYKFNYVANAKQIVSGYYEAKKKNEERIKQRENEDIAMLIARSQGRIKNEQ